MKLFNLFFLMFISCLFFSEITYAQDQTINGNLEVDGWIKSKYDRTIYFGNNQKLYGNNERNLVYHSNNDAYTSMIFYNKQGLRHGHVFGSGSDGQNFGLLDGDGQWSYQAVKDNYTAFHINNSEKMRIEDNGFVGIGTATPTTKLDVSGNIKSRTRTFYLGDNQKLTANNNQYLQYYSNNSTITSFILYDKEGTNYGRLYGAENGANFGLLDGDGQWSYQAVKDNYTAFHINNSEKMRIEDNGFVGIGTTTPQNKLDVCGIIRGSEIVVEEDWCDYVFEENYDLKTIEEEQAHIAKNGHLSGFESEAVMAGEIQIGDVTKRQQQKIEEQMLYIIELNEENKELGQKHDDLSQKYDDLLKLVSELQSQIQK